MQIYFSWWINYVDGETTSKQLFLFSWPAYSARPTKKNEEGGLPVFETMCCAVFRISDVSGAQNGVRLPTGLHRRHHL